jgi:hypothetical protein
MPPRPRSVALTPAGGVDRARVLDAGRGQRFDENPGASDQDVLDDGAIAVIEAEEGVYQLDSASLDQGIIVARFRNLTEIPVPRLSLVPNGRTFWYIYRRKGELLSAYIADGPDSTADRYDIPTRLHAPSRKWRESIAQWQMPGVLDGDKGSETGLRAGLATGSQPWVTCTEAGCCKPRP